LASILIIDDDTSIRQYVRRVLEEDGHHVRESANGDLGLLLYRAAPSELVITDLLMPERDGMEVILALAKEYVGVQIIAMTGAAGEGNLLDVATLLGARQVIRKPFTPEEIRRVVRRTLEHSS
jgi:two-component system response regulator (stage 0 sporulation protein F)